jgi:hypothetical protein
MAKYRITSIPQSLPKAQNGALKKLSNNIQNFIYPRLHPRGNKKTTPVVNEPMTEVQGVQENPMWNDMLSSVDKGETCPPGKYPYNDENGNWTGQCLTESEYQAAADKDFEDWDNKWDKKFNPIIQSIQDERRKLRTEDSERRRNDYDESAKTYYETFNKSKKGDKIKPFQSLPTHVTDSKTPVIDEEGNPVLGEDGQPLMQSFENQLKNKYLVIKNDRGFTDLYPKDIVRERIIKNGFQADQFVNSWGLDRKQVEEQMGPLMEGAMENYTSEVTQSVVKKAVNEGKTTDQVISELSPKVGTKTGLNTKFAEPTKKIIDDVFAQVQEELVNSLSGPNKSSWLDDNIFLSDNPVAAFEKSKTSMTNPGEYLGYIKDKYERGDKEYNKYKKDPKNNYNPNYTFANIDDQFADIRSQVAAKKRVDYEVGAQEARKEGELTEFNDGSGKYISNLSANDLKYFINKALTKAGTTQAGKLDILNTVQNNPERIYKTLLELESDEKVNGKTQTYSDLFSDAARTSFAMAAKHNKENIKNWNGFNENTSGNKLRDVLKYPLDALYFAAHPKEEMWGDSNLSYDTKLGIQKEKGVDLGVMGNDNPLSILRNFTPLQAFNPFKIGMNLRRGYDQGNLTSALGHELVDMGTSYGLGKGFNALGNLKYANRMAAGNNLLGSGLKNTIGLKKGLGTVLSGFDNPLMTSGLLLEVPENIKDVKDEFEAGNYGSAALNALFAYWGTKPAFNTFKSLNALRKPGTVLSNPNFNTQYTGLYDAATPGSGIALGHPGLHTAEPVFKSITNPLNKLGKGLGFGEFSILKQNQGLNTQPVNHSIGRLPSNFNRKNGGTLQRLQGGGGVGKVVKALQELKPIVPEAKTISNQLSLFGADDFTNIIPVAQSGPIANFNVPVVGQTMPVVNNTVRFDLEKQIKKPNKFIYETNQDGDFLTSITKNKENDILRAYVENESGLGKTNLFDHEIKNLNLYTQFLDTYTSYLLPPKHKKFYKDLIEKIKQQDNFASKKQNEELQRLKTGNFDFTRKVYGSAEPKFNEDNTADVINFDYAPKLSSAEKLKVMFMNKVDKQKLLADKTVNEAFEYADKFMSDPEYKRRFADVKAMTPSLEADRQDVANYIRNQVGDDKITSDHYSKDEILNMTDEKILDNFENPYRYNTSNVAWNEADKLPAYVNRTLPIPQQTSVQHLKENIAINPFSNKKVGVYNAGKNQSLTSGKGETVSVGSKNLGDLFNVTVHEVLGHGKTFGNVSFTQKEKELLKSVFKDGNSASTYIKEPTEVMARIDEIRSVINKDNPFKEITENDLDRFESMVNTNKNIPGAGEKGSSLLEFISNVDKSKLKKVMNTMYGAAIIGGAASLMNNPWKQESSIKLNKGGELPKAQYGLESIGKMLKPTNAFRNYINSLHNVDDILPGISPIMRSMSKPKNTFIKTDVPKVDLTKYRNSPGGKSAIKYGDDLHPGEEWYNIDPADYDTNWKEEGLTDASNSLKKYLLNSPEHGPDLFKGVGEFKFKDFSDGWAARNAMMNMASDPQKMLGESDFFTENELTGLVNQQSEWQAARNAFDDMEPENPATAMFRAFSGDNSREELFSNLFPNASMPNFRSKFTTPSQEALLQQHLPWQYSIENKGMLNPNSLKNINGLGDTLPRTYQDLLKAQKDNFLTTSPAKDVVMEMRGGLGLKMEDIQNATPEQLEKWRQQIVKKMNTQASDRWNRDISTPFTGGNAYKQISDTPGYKNKKGGVVTSLSKKEIDQYVKDGYIIEDH